MRQFPSSNETQPAADIDSQLRFLERFIPDNFLPLEFFGGCKGSIANHSACLKMPYNRFLKLKSLHFHIATKGSSLF